MRLPWSRPSSAPGSELMVLMVCMGNICRSPTAEGVLRRRLEQAGLQDRIGVDSAGTLGYHAGEAPDRRAQAHALKRGIDLSGLRARKATAQDFDRFHLVLAMDEDNLADLVRLRPQGHPNQPRLLLDFAAGLTVREVPDPYYGGAEGFERVLDLVDAACTGLVQHLRERLAVPVVR